MVDDPKYKGVRASRKDLMGESGSEEEEEEEEEEEFDEEDMEGTRVRGECVVRRGCMCVCVCVCVCVCR